MWQLRIQDPSGETRIVSLSQRASQNGSQNSSAPGSFRLGRSEGSEVLLRDTTLPKDMGVLTTLTPSGAVTKTDPRHSPYWLKILDGCPSTRLGDLAIREAHIPAGMPICMGETTLTLEARHSEISLPTQPGGIRPWLTCSEEGKKVLWMAKKAASTPLSIYLAGETGTGKEVLAHLLHVWSERASGPFVPLHCGALAPSLAESELFGHVKGAYTGASHHRAGALMQAHNGTLFLDEIGDLPADIQVKLLRFLENGEIRPVGADRTSRADVRLLCATHHSLKQLVEEGKFRRDLYYRLASITIEIPTLRSRPDDIQLLASKVATELGRTITARAMLRLQAHSWPGNVRELRHAIERASGFSGPFTTLLDEDAFEFLLTPEHVSESPGLELGAAVLTLEEMERIMLLKALRLARGNRAQAAKILGVARSTLFEMLKRHKVCGPKHKDLFREVEEFN
ncbi:MAG: sigma-54-dependent Fis family transcriptional regulator [Methylotenera sp.]|nr:sigma-54-dependent Fis family transcriptional regulator [Oligoflexia bacterium]